MATIGREQRYYFLHDLRTQNYDSIRFASYRTVCKLRFIQKKTYLHSIDIWNVIESFRENGLNTLEHQSEINITRLEALISNLYHNLNKRLPSQQQVSVESLSSVLLNWILAAYGAEVSGKIKVLSVKVALATMCAGKLMDKLRYIFSQICDNNGNMVMWKFREYLHEILVLPASVYESPSFPFTSQLANEIFPSGSRVNLNDFIDVMMSDPGPACLVWLPLLHRIAGVENVIHPVACDVCRRENFTGFRYRCQKCHNFQLCQDCFWRGRVAGNHTLEHEVKEYTAYKSPSKQIGHTLRKSFRCVPDKSKTSIPRFPEELEKPINLSHIVPPSPLPTHNGFPEPGSNNSPYDFNSLDSRSTMRSGKLSCLNVSQIDDEHKLIARYAARLAAEASSVGRTTSEGSLSLDTSRAQRELIYQLENKNREIMREIARLRKQQEAEEHGGLEENPALMNELRALRLRKHELETHLTSLQDSRKHLKAQLDNLMKVLKNHQPSPPRATPNLSPHSTKSPPSTRSAPPTPGSSAMQSLPPTDISTGDVRSAFNSTSNGVQSNYPSDTSTFACNRSYRNDLLVAADSVTSAMSTLVRELKSDASDEEIQTSNPNIVRPLDLGNGRNLER